MSASADRILRASVALYYAKIAHSASSTDAELRERWALLREASREWASAMREWTGKRATYLLFDDAHEGGGA